jgi:CheY-like chemotaxis protein
VSTILVVDDEPGIRDVIVLLLRDEGYQVLEAENGPRALKLLSRERPDLVVLDIMMPLMDGREVLRRLRTIPGLETTHVILMSAAAQPSLECWPAGFITKPFDLEHLLEPIRRLIGEP